MKQLVSCPLLDKSWFQSMVCVAIILVCDTVKGACPCPPVNAERAFIACDVLMNSVDTDQVQVWGTACFQGPVQLCSGASGLPNPVIEGLWGIASQGQPVGPGESALQMVGRTRAVTCSGTIVTIDFNQQTADPADAFTLLKTIQAGDTLQFTRINPINCEAEQAVSACAAGSVTGCGPVLTVPVYDASGLSGLYGAVGQYVSLLNFGPKPSTSTQLGQLQDCTDCSPPTCPDLPCWPAQICTGLMTGSIPPECTGITGASEHILVNADHLGAVTVVAVPKTTLGGCSVADILCATRVGDRLRIGAPGVTNQTPLNAPPGQLGWSTSPFEPFGPVDILGDRANAIAIDLDGNTILAGFHESLNGLEQFSALQLIPNGDAVQVGWSTSLLDPFGSSVEDIANGLIVDADGNAMLVGFTDDGDIPKFAALQLVPSGVTVQLGWTTAPIAPFGPVPSFSEVGDRANAATLAADASIILAGQHETVSGVNQFAALQLIPSGATSVQLGWATALFEPFGPVLTGAFLEGDVARAVAIDSKGSIILAGSHKPSGAVERFAALQLIPVGTSVQLGWATALSGPFGPVGSDGDVAYGVVVDCNDNIILAGVHQQPNSIEQMAALQLIPDGTSVMLGWATALIVPFGPVSIPGDEARGIAIDENNTLILGGFHGPSPGVVRTEFAALQLVPNASESVNLGWTATLPGVFGVSVNERANGVAIDFDNNVVLAGFHDPAGAPEEQFAAAQLRQPFVPAYGDYEITSINEVGDFIIFGLTLLDTESSTVCPEQELCIKDFGFCCA